MTTDDWLLRRTTRSVHRRLDAWGKVMVAAVVVVRGFPCSCVDNQERRKTGRDDLYCPENVRLRPSAAGSPNCWSGR